MRAGRAFWVFIGLLVVLHFGLHLSLGIGAWAPDLLTLAVLLAARQSKPGTAAGIGFVLGLLEDAVSSLGAFGAGSIARTIIGVLGARSQDLLVGESSLFVAVYLFVGAWLQDALYYVMAAAVRRGEPAAALLVYAPLDALYVATAGTLAILAYRAVGRS